MKNAIYFKNENNSSKYAVRDYMPEDKEAIFVLWKKHFSNEQIKQRVSPFIRLAEDNYILKSKKVCTYNMLLDNDNLIGYIGTMPVKFYISGKIEHGYYLHDSLIAPSYRGKGLGLFLMKNITNKANSCIIALWMNKAQYNLTKKTGWTDIPGCYSFKRILNLGNYLEIKNKLIGNLVNFLWNTASWLILQIKNFNIENEKSNNMMLKQINIFRDDINEFTKKVSQEYGIILYREKDYLNWKYSNFPGKRYLKYLVYRDNRIAGYIVLCKPDSTNSKKVGIIADLLVENGDIRTFRFLILKSLEIFRKEKIDFVICLIIPTKFKKCLKKIGFFKTKKSNPLMITNFESALSKERILDINNWYLTYGDDDRVIW